MSRCQKASRSASVKLESQCRKVFGPIRLRAATGDEYTEKGNSLEVHRGGGDI